MLTQRRTRRVRQSMLWAAVAAALVVHAAVLGTVNALGLSMISEAWNRGAASPRLVMEEAELKTTCAGDAALTTSGRVAMCFAPWVADVDQCVADAQMSLWIDLSGCQARNDPSTAIAMIEPRAAERLPQIDPEKLVDQFQPETKRPRQQSTPVLQQPEQQQQ